MRFKEAVLCLSECPEIACWRNWFQNFSRGLDPICRISLYNARNFGPALLWSGTSKPLMDNLRFDKEGYFHVLVFYQLGLPTSIETTFHNKRIVSSFTANGAWKVQVWWSLISYAYIVKVSLKSELIIWRYHGWNVSLLILDSRSLTFKTVRYMDLLCIIKEVNVMWGCVSIGFGSDRIWAPQ